MPPASPQQACLRVFNHVRQSPGRSWTFFQVGKCDAPLTPTGMRVARGPRVIKHPTCQRQGCASLFLCGKTAPWPRAALLLTRLPGWGLVLPAGVLGHSFETDVTEGKYHPWSKNAPHRCLQRPTPLVGPSQKAALKAEMPSGLCWKREPSSASRGRWRAHRRSVLFWVISLRRLKGPFPLALVGLNLYQPVSSRGLMNTQNCPPPCPPLCFIPYGIWQMGAVGLRPIYSLNKH